MRSGETGFTRPTQRHTYLAVQAHSQIGVQVGIHEHRRQQVRKVIIGSLRGIRVEFVFALPAEILVSRAQDGPHVSVQAHDAVRIQV